MIVGYKNERLTANQQGIKGIKGAYNKHIIIIMVIHKVKKGCHFYRTGNLRVYVRRPVRSLKEDKV